MKVSVVSDYNWQDYEGGGGEVVAVFLDRAKAVEFIENQFPDYKFDGCNWANKKRPDNYWIQCDDWEVK